MADRTALLIGVPTYDNDLFEATPHVIAADMRRMSEALVQSDYSIARCGTEPGSVAATFNGITGAMKKAFREAPEGGVLVVYYSGHGVVIGGRSYLVPKDAYGGPKGPDPESLVPLVPRGLDECRARLVVFFVDACRNDLSGALDLPRCDELPCPPNGAFVMVNSCGPGEWSGYGDDGSYFTQAVAEALDRRSPARTLGEVTTVTVKQLARRRATSDDVRQTPTFVVAHSGLTTEPVESMVICHGDKVVESWREAVESSRLWRRSSVDDRMTDAIRREVLGVIDACARHWLNARAHLVETAKLTDPWSTQDYSVRVLASLESLIGDDTRLRPAEMVSLIAAPFLREVALSAGLILAAGIKPCDFTRLHGERARSDLEITHDMHEHVWRRAEGLARRNWLEARDTLAMWLVHRWLAGRSSLWTDPAVTALVERLSPILSGHSGLTPRELPGHLGVLMRCVDGDYDDRTLVAQLERNVIDARFRALGAMLWLSGILAADPRRMPSVIVDHIGVTDELSLASVHQAAREIRWISTGDELTLEAACDHPALYTVFEGIAKRAAGARKTLCGIDLHPDLARHLPATVTADRLRPEKIDGVLAFDTPVLRFRLSDEKVRELLMGRQLYGQPDLAIRELYQNALDACRYRRTRREYRRRTGGDTVPWIGRIAIKQGEENGRPFIECADNGVGMGPETLENTFANAGERFIYRPAFRAEHTRWQDLEPPLDLVPNSQFGVGVFSYFMIAEEIAIWTWPTSEDDVAEAGAYRVRIASSGSLFQITPADRPAGGGTIVRLYLTGDESVSVLRTMRRLLRVAEFEVTVTEAGGSVETWAPEELRYPGAAVAPLRHGDDFWWVSDEGGLVADGIRTNEERFGLVVNLRNRRRPRFTVDRNRLRGWDRDWINTQVTESLPTLAQWPGLTLNWLWNVTRNTPQVSEKIFDWLVEHDKDLPVEGSWAHGTAPPVSRIGCLPADRDLFSGELNGWSFGFEWLSRWRTAVWAGYARFQFMDHVATPECLDGFPVVRPLDAAVIDRIYSYRWGSSARFGRPSVDDLFEAAADEDETPVERLRRLRRYAVIGLDLSAVRHIPPLRHRFHLDDPQPERGLENKDLLAAVAAWARPGEPPRRGSGGWLALASMNLHAPLAEVIRRASALVPADWVPPRSEVVTALGHDVFTATDVEMFSQHTSIGSPWIAPDVPPSQVMRISAKHGKSVPDVLAAFDRFAELGYSVIGRDHLPADMQPVEHDALLLVDEMRTPVSPLHLLLMANRHEMTMQKVRESLGRLADAEFLVLPPACQDEEITPTDDELEIIQQRLFGYDPHINGQRLSVGWMAFRRLASYVHGRDADGVRTRVEACRRLLNFADPGRPVTAPEMLDLAYITDSSVGAAVALYQLLLPQTADITELPKAAPASDLTIVEHSGFWALVSLGRFLQYREAELTWTFRPGDFAAAAANARLSIPSLLDRMEPYRAFGAPLPILDAQERASLESHIVDKYDAAMLVTVDELGLEEPLETVTPLILVQTAGRFGWTVADTRARMARFEPLGLTVPCPAEACPDEIVHWQDLLMLSIHLDGQEPVIQGHVDAAHLDAAAEEVGATVDHVRQRLTRYAELFGFDLEPAAGRPSPECHDG
ncbi:caspase family protein [Micromonospora sp. WMMD1102]|uniref:wHTH domain-containing protein n=1 Tax=Micromonospora sp. WMMD1102 TaxID=3016105 RepID=UPI002414E7FE|nr:caspase family protein [Micromonospora sp. WMMD1102]MDG4787561.1 caspase family protein [Micromonospora sp. WMMD1102]